MPILGSEIILSSPHLLYFGAVSINVNGLVQNLAHKLIAKDICGTTLSTIWERAPGNSPAVLIYIRYAVFYTLYTYLL